MLKLILLREISSNDSSNTLMMRALMIIRNIKYLRTKYLSKIGFLNHMQCSFNQEMMMMWRMMMMMMRKRRITAI